MMIAIPTQADNYIKNIVYEDLLKYLFIGDGVAGGATTYLCDCFYAHNNLQNSILLSGGGWFSGDTAGVAIRSADDVAATANLTIGARLEFI